jgi:hypothetical protein
MQVSDYNMVSTGSAEEMNVHRPIRVNSYLLDLLLVILFWKKYSFLETCGSNIFHRSDSCSDPIYPTGQIPAQIQYILQVRFLLRSNISYRSDSCSDPIYPTGQIPAHIDLRLLITLLVSSNFSSV